MLYLYPFSISNIDNRLTVKIFAFVCTYVCCRMFIETYTWSRMCILFNGIVLLNIFMEETEAAVFKLPKVVLHMCLDTNTNTQ